MDGSSPTEAARPQGGQQETEEERDEPEVKVP
jgi:hypothetical protein